MDPNRALAVAATQLTKDATLEELREAVRDLRALAPSSVLADLVEQKIEMLLSQGQEVSMGSSSPTSGCNMRPGPSRT